MAKKRKTDFQKTKLRVGKTLPKGGNVTDTSFTTRKIVTRDQLKENPGVVSLKELLNYLGHTNVTTKKENLHKLKNYIEDKKDSLCLFFPDVLKRVGVLLREGDYSVREVAIDVLHTCLRYLTNAQITCFFANLSSYLVSMMTHYNKVIQKDSLKLLDRILETHPTVFCHSTKILCTMLNLISSAVHDKNPSKGRKRKLEEHFSSNMTSQAWRMEVLKRVYNMLQHALGVEIVSKYESEDEREVYWDAKEPLYLPLYLRGGTTPVPLESLKDDSFLKNTNSQEFKDFVYELVPLLSEIITGEIPFHRSAGNGDILETSVIEQLNIVTQLMCLLSEWLHQKSVIVDIDKKIYKLFSDICQKLSHAFPYAQHDSSFIKKRNEKKNGSDCMQLNLGVGYLYCLLILDSESRIHEIEMKINNYLKDVFHSSCAMCDKSISLILKISKLSIVSSNVIEDYKNGILLGLYKILEVHEHSPSTKPIFSFFIDVSLNYDFKYLLDLAGMKTWFKIILKEVASMMKSGSPNKKFLKYVRQICSRRYQYFMELLNNVKKDVLLGFLQYDNEEFQLTITHLICAMDDPSDFLQDMAELMTDPSFNLKTATRMIYLLHSRFSGQDAHGREKLLFLKFLLNLGCDTPVLTDPTWESSEACSDTLRTVLETCHYGLYPTLKWKRHLQISKACFDCLPTYIQIDPLAGSTVTFVKSVLMGYRKMPIHCAIALLQVRRKVFDIYQDEELILHYYELIFSSLMYLSVMHIDGKKEGLEPYAVPELQKSLELDRCDVPDIISIIENSIYSFGENDLYHTLRMTLYLIHAKILQIDDRNSFYAVLEKINSTCQRSKLLHPLWISICKFFLFM